MNEERVDELMKKYKEELVVDEAFKQSLRKTFEQKRSQSQWFRQFSVLGMIASLLLVVYTFFDAGVTHVNASSLKIWDQLSLADVGDGEEVSLAEHDGTLYLSLKEKGIFAFGDLSFTKVADQKVSSFAWSEAGDEILISTEGSIGLYDTRSHKSRLIRTGEQGVVYSHPAWMGEQAILFEKREGGSQESAIIRLDLATMQETELGSGKKPSYVKQEQAILFERDGKIYLRDEKSLEEREIATGFDPAVSVDGEYVAYVKAESSMENVWVSDIRNGTQKQITANIANTNPDLGLEVGQPIYRFSNPVWSADSSQVYVLKQRRGAGAQVTRIDLAKNKLTAEETVKKYLQALMSREEDFAKSLMAAPPAEPLTGSNPRVVGYHLSGTGTENDRTYVDAEAYWSYTANPYYQIVSSRYYLTPSENGYVISDIQQRETIEVTSPENEQIQLITDGAQQLLFEKKAIPAEYVEKGDFRVASFAYDKPAQTLYFTLQYMKGEGSESHSFVTLLAYDVTTKQFRELDQIKEIDGGKDVGVSNVTLDPGGQFVSVDLYVESANPPTSVTYVYNTKTGDKLDLRTVLQDTEISGTYAQYWEGGKTTFQVVTGGLSLLFEYLPKK